MIGELADTITSGFDQETNDVQATLAAPSVSMRKGFARLLPICSWGSEMMAGMC
jgi:hypothetical protein